MKTIFKTLFVFLTLAVSMASCRDDYEMPDSGAPDNSEQLVAGTYVGEWSRTNVNTGAVETKPGSITFGIVDNMPNVSSMTLLSDGLDLGVSEKTSVCNISRLSSGNFSYWNTETKNPFGMLFTGTISSQGVATMKYTKIVRSGRREVEFNYSFTGTK